MAKINLTLAEQRVRISDEQAGRARRMKERGRTWAQIAERLGVPEVALIRRLDRALARKLGLRAPGWLYEKGTKHPDYERDEGPNLLTPRRKPKRRS